MKTVWTKGLSEDRADEVKREYAASAASRERLKAIIEEKITSSRVGLRDKTNYENSSWAYQQADGIGYERALYEIISLIS